MAFSEEIKRTVRRRSDMRCCICRQVGVEIHHIVPQAEGGPDSEENAAALCPSCHEMLGANPTKRKFIQEARDNWYEVCDRRFASEAKLDQLIAAAENAVTRSDLEGLRSEVLNAVARIIHAEKKRPRERTLGEVVQHLFDHSRPGAKNGMQQGEWLYEFIWGGALGDAEAEEIKAEFVSEFGRETAKRTCHFVLQDHPYDILSNDGFTEPEMAALVNGVMVTAILLLQHVDLAGPEVGLALGVDPGGDIRAWISKGASSPKHVAST